MSNSSFAIVCQNAWHSTFLALLPQIRNYVMPAFRSLREAEQDDAVQDAIVHAFVMFVRLMERGRSNLIFPTVLARFAILHVREGRSLGTRMNSRDVASKSAQFRRDFVVARLDQYDGKKRRWLDAVIEDHRTAVADQAAFRIDFPEWLSGLSARNRRIAESLAYGNSTNAVARRFRVSAARIAQIRSELRDSWQGFHEGVPLRRVGRPQGNRATNPRRRKSAATSSRKHRDPNRIAAAAWSGHRATCSVNRFPRPGLVDAFLRT